MPATIFSGAKVKALKDRLSLNDRTEILSVSADPSSGLGQTAPLGSIAMDYLAGKVYKKTGALATEWQELGAGLGGINYIENPDAESGITGWATYKDANQPAPVDGTGGTAAITWTRSIISPLRGVADFNLSKGAGDLRGEGVSYDFTIDSADQAKILTIGFDYEVLSGTYASGDLAVYIIQDPAGTPVVIQPAGYQVEAATVGNKVREACTFQTASNVTSYRLCIHVASTSASAYSLAIDNVSVSPQQVVYGAPVTDWQSYTPTFTGFGAVSVQSFWWRRAGDSVEIKGRFTSATSTATEARISLPSGLTSDSAKVHGTLEIAGKFNFNSSSTTFFSSGSMLIEPSVSYLTFGLESSTTNGLTKANGSSLVISGQLMSLFAKVPIAGWSSSVVVSSSADTRVVASNYKKTANQAVTGNVTDISFDSRQFDTHSAWTGSAYVAPVPGYYSISGSMNITTATSVNLAAFVNGVSRQIVGTVVGGNNVTIGGLVFLEAGQSLSIRSESNITILGSAGVLGPYLAIQRLSGPAQIAASETVAIRYTNTAGTSLSAGVDTNIPFATKVIDTHGAYNTATGVFTAPIAGLYQVNCSLLIFATIGTGDRFRAFLTNTSTSQISDMGRSNGTGAANNHATNGATVVNMLAGQTLTITANSSVSTSLTTQSGNNVLSIVRVGN